MIKTDLCSWLMVLNFHHEPIGYVRTNYLSRGENLSSYCLSQVEIFVNYMENKVRSLRVFLLSLHYFCSPAESGPAFGQAVPVCLVLGSPGDALRFSPRPLQRAAGSS